MSIIAIPIFEQKSITSENLLTKFCTFNEVFTWNVVSGGSNAVAENSINNKMYGTRSCEITFTGVGAYEFNCGGSQMDFTAQRDGDYIPSWWLNKTDNAANVTFAVTCLVNGLFYSNYVFLSSLNTTDGYINDNWNCYYGGLISLLEGDVVTWLFETESDIYGSGVRLYFDGLKLELNNMNLNTEPSYYSEPLPIIIEKTTNIDIASVPDNDFVFTTQSMIGAVVGDEITMIAPSAFNALELVTSVYVSATDQITIKCGNFSGAAINPSAGDFKFKIVR